MENKFKPLLVAVIALCMLLIQFNPEQAQAKIKKGKSGSISYEAHDTGSGVILILKSGSKNVLNVSAKVVYYDSNKKMIETSSDKNYALHGKKKMRNVF